MKKEVKTTEEKKIIDASGKTLGRVATEIAAVLLGKDKERDPMEGYDAFVPAVDGNPLSDEARKKLSASDMANGGMVQPMPTHYDSMSWQRQSFKK